MNAIEGIAKVLFCAGLILGIIIGAVGDEAFAWAVQQVNNLTG